MWTNGEATRPYAPFREVKRTLGGGTRVYECEALRVTPNLAIVRFVFTKSLTTARAFFPGGAYTIGFFWRGRHYNLYHTLTADDQLVADRFDIVDDVRIRRDGVRYDDLFLDVWLYPDGRTRVEDEDELEAAVAAGQLTLARQQIITRTRRLLLHRSVAIVSAALADLQELDRL
jgi:hypothetical protein